MSFRLMCPLVCLQCRFEICHVNPPRFCPTKNIKATNDTCLCRRGFDVSFSSTNGTNEPWSCDSAMAFKNEKRHQSHWWLWPCRFLVTKEKESWKKYTAVTAIFPSTSISTFLGWWSMLPLNHTAARCGRCDRQVRRVRRSTFHWPLSISVRGEITQTPILNAYTFKTRPLIT